MQPELTPLEIAVTNAFADGTADGLTALAWLAGITNFLGALPSGHGRTISDPITHAEHNAKRAVFGRVYEILVRSDRGREALSAVLISPLDQPED